MEDFVWKESPHLCKYALLLDRVGNMYLGTMDAYKNDTKAIILHNFKYQSLKKKEKINSSWSTTVKQRILIPIHRIIDMVLFSTLAMDNIEDDAIPMLSVIGWVSKTD